MLTSEILDKAADIIEQRGWWQGSYKKPGPDHYPVCALGAINVAAGSHPNTESSFKVPCATSAAANALADHLCLNPGDDLIDVLGNGWNDVAESAEEVVRELRAAAASEREAGR